MILLGIGVVPIAIIATVFAGLWITVGHIILLILVTWLARIAGITLIRQCVPIFDNNINFEEATSANDFQSNSPSEDVIDVESTNIEENEEK